MAEVYRYILDESEKNWTQLKDEIKFAEKYLNLIQIRFEDSLEIYIEAEIADAELYLAPLTLQLLLENIIKHNALSREKKLKIEIYQESDFLVVKNNLNPKSILQKRKGKGLQNIINQYTSIDKKVIVQESATAFHSKNSFTKNNLSMNAIIIEDEAVAARYLKSLAEKQGVHILCSLQSVKESIEWLKTHPSPELIFLDVQLGDGLSFEIFEHIQPQSAIIFTTAYSEYALRAFKLNSIDYLLKPINETELANALAKYRQQKQKEFFDFNTIRAFFNQYSSNYKERFLTQIGQELKSFLTEEISMFYSEEKTTFLVYKNREYPIDFSLSELEKSLNPQLFFRISRQAIVRHTFIENIYSYSGNRLRLKIKYAQGDWIVSRERVVDFKNWLA